MRMHEDVRPFGCGLCDQTFRQKAHLQRHETTHGIGVKVTNRSAGGGSSGGGGGAPRRKRKRSSRGSTGSATSGMTQLTTTDSSPPPASLSANLQQRLARVSEQFGTIKEGDLKVEHHPDDIDHSHGSPHAKHARLTVRVDQEGNIINDDSTGPNTTAAFQPYIATAEEAAVAEAEAAGQTRASQVLTAAVNEAISDINEAMMF